MDDFEGIALSRGLVVAGEELGVPVRSDVTLTDGFDFVPGAGSLGVGVDWAVDPLTPLDEVSEYFENGSGFHILEVVSRTEEGTFTFAEVRPQIEETLRAEMRTRRALEIAAGKMDEVGAAPSLEEAAESLGWTYGQAGPFLRGQFVQGLGRGTEAVGAAFGAGLSAQVKSGMRAVSIKADAVSGISGMLAPGDLVDIIATDRIAGSKGGRVSRIIYRAC